MKFIFKFKTIASRCLTNEINSGIFLIVWLSLFSSNMVYADTGDQYALAKVGSLRIAKNNADPLIAAGFIYGVGMSRSLTFEGEATVSLSGGEYKIEGDEGNYSMWTAATYIAYRYVFSDFIYLKLKGGIVYESVKREGRTNSTSTGVGGAGGGGLGFILPLSHHPVMFELEATATEKDIIFYSLGMTYPF